MIDKDTAELKALRTGKYTSFDLSDWKPEVMFVAVFPDSPVRVCQFHAIQALLRWFRTQRHRFTRDDDLTADLDRHDVDEFMQLTAKLLDLFRTAQRTRNRDDWPAARKVFNRGLTDVLGEEHSKVFIAYFDKYWWCETWLGMLSQRYKTSA